MNDPNSFHHAWTPGGLWLNGPHQENEERLKDNQREEIQKNSLDSAKKEE